MTQDEIRFQIKAHSLVAGHSLHKIRDLQQLCPHPNRVRYAIGYANEHGYRCPDCEFSWEVGSGTEWKPGE